MGFIRTSQDIASTGIINQYYTRQFTIIPGVLWVEVSKELKVGQATGTLGLTYAIKSFDNVSLNIKTSEGQIVGVDLKSYGR